MASCVVMDWKCMFVTTLQLIMLSVSKAENRATLENIYNSYDEIYCVHQDEFVPGNLLICEGNRLSSLNPATGERDIIAGYYFGYGEGVGQDAAFRGVYDAVHSNSSTEIVIDHGNECLRKIHRKTNQTETLAGKCGTVGSADGNFEIARFHFPYKMTKLGNTLYVTGYQYSSVRVVDLEIEVVSSLSLAEFVRNPSGITHLPNTPTKLLITFENGVAKHDTKNGVCVWEAGARASGDAVDESLRDAFNSPRDVVALSDNWALISDRDNGKVKLLDRNLHWLTLVVSVDRVTAIDRVNGEIYIGYGSTGVVSKLRDFQLPTTTRPPTSTRPTTSTRPPTSIRPPSTGQPITRGPPRTDSLATTRALAISFFATLPFVPNVLLVRSSTTSKAGTMTPRTTALPFVTGTDSIAITPNTVKINSPERFTKSPTSSTLRGSLAGASKVATADPHRSDSSEGIKIGVGTGVAVLIIISASITILYFIKKQYDSKTGPHSRRMEQYHQQSNEHQNDVNFKKESSFNSRDGGGTSNSTNDHIYERVDYDPVIMRGGGQTPMQCHSSEYMEPTDTKQQQPPLYSENGLYSMYAKQRTNYNVYERPSDRNSHYARPDSHSYAAMNPARNQPVPRDSVPWQQPSPPPYVEVLSVQPPNPPNYEL